MKKLILFLCIVVLFHSCFVQREVEIYESLYIVDSTTIIHRSVDGFDQLKFGVWWREVSSESFRRVLYFQEFPIRDSAFYPIGAYKKISIIR